MLFSLRVLYKVEQGALRKEVIFAPFVERYKTATLRKASCKFHQYLLQIALWYTKGLLLLTSYVALDYDF